MKEEQTTADKRATLIDLAQGGDGRVPPFVEHLEPPEVINGHAYAYRVVEIDQAGRQPTDRRYLYVDTLEQADKLLHIGDLEI